MFPLLLSIVILLLLLSGLLAASETSLFALLRMDDTREKLSAPVRNALERLMEHPLEALVLIIGLNEACNVFADCLATILFLDWLGPVGAWWAAPVMLVTVLLFCDITPKTFALGYPGGVARISARPLATLVSWTHPLVGLMLPSVEPPRPAALSEGEFKALLRAGEVVGEIEPQERELIHRVFDFGQRRVAELMMPRDQIFAIDIATPRNQLVLKVLSGHFSRVPIYRGSLDNMIGILHVKDLVTRRLDPGTIRLDRIVRPAYFVPPAKPVGELFDEMRRGRFQIALVVDEYGGLLGLITLEDLLEELFGEIHDEFDYEGPELTPVGPHEWLASGRIEMNRLHEAIDGANLISNGAETLSALLLRKLRRVPRPGEKIRLGDIEAGIERVHGATIELVRLRR